MKMRRFVIALALTSTCSGVYELRAEPEKARTGMSGRKAAVFHRDTYRNGFLVGRRNETVVYGNAREPARYESPNLTISARQIAKTAFTDQVRAAKDYPHAPQVWLRGTLFSKADNAATAIEVRCDTFEGSKTQWLLQGNVSGFYRNARGRFPLRGENISVDFNDDGWVISFPDTAFDPKFARKPSIQKPNN